MTRVVHISTVHDRRDPRIFEKELASLARAGYAAAFIAQGRHDVVLDGVKIHPIGVANRRSQRLRLMWPAYRAAIRSEASLFHIHDPELIPLARMLKSRTGARVIYDMHEDYAVRRGFEGRLIPALERWACRWTDAVVVAHAEHAERVISLRGRSVTVRNYFWAPGPQPQPKVSPTDRAGRTNLLYSGVVSSDRGLDTLIRLARRIDENRRAVQVRIVGVCHLSADRQQAEREMQVHGIPDSLSVEGWSEYVPHKLILSANLSAHVGLVLWRSCYDHRTMPTKFYEYLYYGLPIICSDLPPWRKFVTSHDCGVTVPIGDPEAVENAVERYREQPELYRRHSAAAVEASNKYRWESEEARLLQIYSDLIGPPQTG